MKRPLQQLLSTHLRRLGMLISKHPIYFIILPCALSTLLSTGLLVIKYENDIQKLAAYEDGRASKDQSLVEAMFPMNSSEFADPVRVIDNRMMFVVHVLNRKGGNVLQEGCMRELQIVDEIVKNATATYDGRTITYGDICGRAYGRCQENPVVSLLPYKELIASKRKKIEYPFFLDPLTYHTRLYVLNIGGVTPDEDGFVEEAEAFRLIYMKDASNSSKLKEIESWVNAVVAKLDLVNFSHLTVQPFDLYLASVEIKEIADSFLPLTGAVVAIVGIFSSVTSMTSSWISSKPWLGLGACVSAGLGLISSLGITFHCGVPATPFIMGIPFLILGTEVDDAYILIATWRKTDPREPVSKRMGDTFAEAGVSITITSITNVTSFCIGIMTPFNGVKYFCAHAAVALVFTYLYMITFFGGLMALDGFREKNQMNAITFRKSSERKRKDNCDNEEIITMKVFKEVVGKSLEKTPVKIIVIICFATNLAFGFYGTSHLEDGLELENLLTSNSPMAKSTDTFYRHFTSHYGMLHVIINEPLNYADHQVQNSLDEMLQKFWNHPKIGGRSNMVFWLHFYKIFQNSFFTRISMSGFNFSKEEDFITGLDVFLQIPQARQFQYDILFNKNHSQILTCRFLLSIMDIETKREQTDLVRDMWRIADESKFNVTVYSPAFSLLEQGVIIRNIVFQLIWVTSLLMFVVFFAFIPSFMKAVIVMFSVISALVATVGYMALWGVKLDIVSTTVLVLSIGFSVNYPSHVACAFSLAKGGSANEKMKESLYHVGLPILQGCLSTILGASILDIKNSYVCKIFPKLILLISLQTAFHAMFVLPVSLCLVSQFKIPQYARNMIHHICSGQKKNQASDNQSALQ